MLDYSLSLALLLNGCYHVTHTHTHTMIERINGRANNQHRPLSMTLRVASACDGSVLHFDMHRPASTRIDAR